MALSLRPLMPVLLLAFAACAKRPDVVLTNRFQNVDDSGSVLGVELGTYYATFVGEVDAKLELTPVTDLVARCENESVCRAQVRDEGRVLEVVGLAEGEAVVGVRYARPNSLRPEHRRVRFHFFSVKPNPELEVGAEIPKAGIGGWEVAAKGERPAARCLRAGRGGSELAKDLGVEGRRDIELFSCSRKREVAPGDSRPPQDCVGLCPPEPRIVVCAELREGQVQALAAFEPTGDEMAPYRALEREGAEGGPCGPRK